MINSDDITGRNRQEQNLHWLKIPDHPYRILLAGGFRSGKPNALLNLINQQQDIDKLYLYFGYLYESKYHFLINKHEEDGQNY